MRGNKTSTPTVYNTAGKNKKVVGNDEPTTTLRSNVEDIDRGILDYVRTRMGRTEVTGEVIGQALVFQAEIGEMQ